MRLKVLYRLPICCLARAAQPLAVPAVLARSQLDAHLGTGGQPRDPSQACQQMHFSPAGLRCFLFQTGGSEGC